MLGRTAHDIFWMYRYLERAENTARLLEAGQRMALTRSSAVATEEWKSVVSTLGLRASYETAHGDYSGAQVCDFVLRAKSNPESVLAMIERARTSARRCRTSLTTEVWEAVNDAWMTLRDLLARPVRVGNLGTALAAIRRESTIARGATHGSMLRNEIYSFARAGTFIERADNTARILDVKYYVLLPSISYVGTPLDTGQWEHVLRSLSGDRAYRWLNAGRMDAGSIAEFLILDTRFPRSLVFCYAALHENLTALARSHGHEGEANALVLQAYRKIAGSDVDAIFERGLHEFLLEFIVANRRIAEAIAQEYRFVA